MADNSVVGSIALELGLNANAFKKQLKNLGKSTDSSIQSMKNSFSSAFTKIAAGIATAFSVSKIIDFGKESVEAAANVQAATAQFEQTFGTMQSTAENVMKSVADSSGIIETRLQSVGTSIYAFAKTTGMDSAQAISLMGDALQITADSAAYYDRSLEDTAESLKSFLKGNYENDAALGLSCTETTRNAMANKLYGKSFQDLSESQKQLTLLEMVKQANQLSGAMGQASREADGWENVTGNLKEAWKQFLAVVGQPVLQTAVAVIKQITSAIQQLTAYAKTAISAFSKLFNFGSGTQDVSSALSDTASSVSSLPADTSAVSDNMSDTAKSAEKIKKSLAGFDQLNILSDNSDKSSGNDTGSTSSSVDSTSIITPEFEASNTEKSVNKMIDNIQNKLQSFYKNSGIEDFVAKVQKGINIIDFAAMQDNFKSIMKSLQPIAKSTTTGLEKIFKSFMGFIGSVVSNIISVSGKVLQTISGGIAQWLEQDKDKISGYIDTISTNISSSLDNISSFIDTIVDTAGGSIDRMRPTIENSISSLLGGVTNFTSSCVIIISGAFDDTTNIISQWAEDNEDSIGELFDNIQYMGSDTMSFIGKVFDDIGTSLTDWWTNNGGKAFWDEICKIITDVGTVCVNVFNNWVKPTWDKIVEKVSSMWSACKPVIDKALNLISKIGELIKFLWDSFLKPVIDWLVSVLEPAVRGVVTIISGIVSGLFNAICGVIGGLIDAISGIIDFIVGIFTGDWEKAWNGVCEIFSGIFSSIWDFVCGIASAIGDTLIGLCEILMSAFQIVWDTIVGFFTVAWDAIVAVWDVVVDFFQGIWDGICKVFSAVGKWFIDVFQGAWDGICKAWNGVTSFFSGIWSGIKNTFSSIGNWFSNIFSGAWDGIKNAWSGVSNFFSNIWSGIQGAFSHVTDWFKNVFSGAWESIKNVFSTGGKIFDGIKDGILNAFKFVVNGIIDGLNWVIAQPFNGINNALKTIKYLDFWGWKPFEWINEIPVPQIPKLARGGLVTAPTLALVGDNRNAQSDPEVVAPLSRLKGMISEEYQTGSNGEVLAMLKRIYDVLSNQETQYTNVVYLDSEEIERKLVKIRKRKSRRYGGATT